MASFFDPVIYITCRDRLTCLLDLLEWLERAGHARIVLVDNASTYEPLLDYYEHTVHEVLYLGENWGSRAVWLAHLDKNEYFVVSDPDIVPTEDCPVDLVLYLKELLDEYRQYAKAGVGLYLDDLPAGLDPRTIAWERRLLVPEPYDTWQGELAPGVYGSLVDTTFALYRPRTVHFLPGLRTGRPYQARHTSWYTGMYLPGVELSEEDAYYVERAHRGPLGSSIPWAARS